MKKPGKIAARQWGPPKGSKLAPETAAFPTHGWEILCTAYAGWVNISECVISFIFDSMFD